MLLRRKVLAPEQTQSLASGSTEKKYRALLDLIEEGFCIIEVLFDQDKRPIDYRFLEMNQAFEQQTGLKSAVGRTVREFLPAMEQIWIDRYGAVALTGEPVRFTKYAEPMEKWLDVYAFRPDAEETNHVALFVKDITLAKLAELKGKSVDAELLRRERRSSNVLDSLFPFVGVLTPDGTLIEVNRALFDVAGISASEVLGLPLGLPFWDTDWWSYSPEVQHQLEEAVERAQKGEVSRYNVDVRMKNSELITIDFMLAPLCDSEGNITHLVASAVPITEGEKTEAGIRLSESRLQRISESGVIAVLYWDLNGGILDSNNAFLDLLGYSRAELEQGLIDWRKITPPEWQEVDAKGVAQILEKGVADPFEKEYCRKDGSRVWVVIASAAFEGEPEKGVSIVLDISERKRMEVELLRANEDLQQFAWAASHDLQEPLRMVTSFTQLIRKRYGKYLGEEGNKFIEYAVEGASRMETMLSGLRDYWQSSGSRDQERGPVSLQEVVEQALGNLQTAIDETKAEILVDSLPVLSANPSMILLVFQNLIGNALKYRHPERSPRVHIGVTRQGNVWQFSVTDNGIGIDPRYHEQIFGIFKRLHGRQEYAGAGIGLALCQKIAQRHGGRIWVESDGKSGSQFYFTLPAM